MACCDQLGHTLGHKRAFGPQWLSRPKKTLDNTLGAMVGDRQLVRPRRGHYGLAPALIQCLKADCLVGSNSERSQSEREVSEVPDQVPTVKTGNNEVPAGKPPGSQQTRCSTGHQQQLLPMRHQPWGGWGERPALGPPTGLTDCFK